jgi:hypothetical protein
MRSEADGGYQVFTEGIGAGGGYLTDQQREYCKSFWNSRCMDTHATNCNSMDIETGFLQWILLHEDRQANLDVAGLDEQDRGVIPGHKVCLHAI